MADTDNRILADFADAVRCGLAREQKEIPARYLYDRRGSDLFEEITRLPEYYPTRTEIELIRKHSGTIADRVGHGRTVVEFGSGSSAKTPSFLSAVRAAAYVPVDISADMLADAAKSVAAAMPGLDVHPLAGDFTRPLDLPAAVRTSPKLGFFPGSTIGNMTAAEAVDLLRAFGGTLGGDAHLAIGVDLVKNAAILEPAYDDAKGITAEFILGILRRLEDDLGAELQQRDWRYRSFWNPDMRRIEMHIEATRDTAIALDGARWTVAKGETIHVSNSHKYSLSDAAVLARAAGFRQVEAWTDDDGLFSLQLWRALPEDLCW
ncbi:MAG: L-histidine N(alpha)-methyltransferase [Pseudomonadota bacterium]